MINTLQILSVWDESISHNWWLRRWGVWGAWGWANSHAHCSWHRRYPHYLTCHSIWQWGGRGKTRTLADMGMHLWIDRQEGDNIDEGIPWFEGSSVSWVTSFFAFKESDGGSNLHSLWEAPTRQEGKCWWAGNVKMEAAGQGSGSPQTAPAWHYM